MNTSLSFVQHLITSQFPQWTDLPIKAIEPGDWDNRTFRLGTSMSVILPSAAKHASNIEKEYYWLPKLDVLTNATYNTMRHTTPTGINDNSRILGTDDGKAFFICTLK